MRAFAKGLAMLAVSPVILMLAACSTLTGQSEVPASAKAVAESIGNMRTREADTCETKKAAAEINSKIDTIKLGKETVYKADCKPTQQAVNAKATS